MSKVKVSTVQVFPVHVGKGFIYTVTCYQPSKWDKKRILAESRCRVWGWLKDKSRAIKAILGNETDMFEDGYYTYAIVEKVREGICSHAEAIQWFHYDHKTRMVKRIKTPDFAKRTCNFSMG